VGKNERAEDMKRAALTCLSALSLEYHLKVHIVSRLFELYIEIMVSRGKFQIYKFYEKTIKCGQRNSRRLHGSSK